MSKLETLLSKVACRLHGMAWFPGSNALVCDLIAEDNLRFYCGGKLV